jgi:hypothetical protein
MPGRWQKEAAPPPSNSLKMRPISTARRPRRQGSSVSAENTPRNCLKRLRGTSAHAAYRVSRANSITMWLCLSGVLPGRRNSASDLRFPVGRSNRPNPDAGRSQDWLPIGSVMLSDGEAREGAHSAAVRHDLVVLGARQFGRADQVVLYVVDCGLQPALAPSGVMIRLRPGRSRYVGPGVRWEGLAPMERPGYVVVQNGQLAGAAPEEETEYAHDECAAQQYKSVDRESHNSPSSRGR